MNNSSYLYVFPVLQLSFILLLLVLELVFPCFDKLVVVALVRVDSLGVHMQDVCSDAVEKRPVVRHAQDGCRPRL